VLHPGQNIVGYLRTPVGKALTFPFRSKEKQLVPGNLLREGVMKKQTALQQYNTRNTAKKKTFSHRNKFKTRTIKGSSGFGVGCNWL